MNNEENQVNSEDSAAEKTKGRHQQMGEQKQDQSHLRQQLRRVCEKYSLWCIINKRAFPFEAHTTIKEKALTRPFSP